jgi:alpha-mannosidase
MSLELNLYFVLPCHGLEDFPTHLYGFEAENLLTTWTAAWHPALLAAANRLPILLRGGIDDPVEPGGLVFLPDVAATMLDSETLKNYQQSQITLVQGTPARPLNRQAMLEQGIAGRPELRQSVSRVADQWRDDFYALSFAYLQIELMTRQLRHSSSLNQDRFQESVIEGAKAVVAQEHQVVSAALQKCFDLLLQDRNCYYPVEPQLLDMVLINPQTLRGSLTKQLDRRHRFSLSLTGQVFRKMKELNPASVLVVEERLRGKELEIVGGFDQELPAGLLSSESELRQLLLGRQVFTESLQMPVKVFFQQSIGLHSNLPTLLEKMEFLGAIHATVSGAGVPHTAEFNIRWESPDCGYVAALGLPLLNAADAGALLSLGPTIGRQLDSAHSSAILFAHWPNQYCQAFEDLLRCEKYYPVLGRWKTPTDYFESTYDPGYGSVFQPNEYRHFFLRYGLEHGWLDPVSRFQDYWATHYQVLAWQGLSVHLGGGLLLPNEGDQPEPYKSSLSAIAREIELLEQCRDELADPSSEIDAVRQKIETTLSRLESMSGIVADSSPRSQQPAVSSPDSASLLVFNPLNFRRSNSLLTPPLDSSRWNSKQGVMFCESVEDQSRSVVELSGNTALTIPLAVPAVRKTAQGGSSRMLEKQLIRNEFLEVQVDPQGGGIAGIYSYQHRRSIASQQLAIRIPSLSNSSDPDNSAGKERAVVPARYSRMVADELWNTQSGTLNASITSTGYLQDGEVRLARFTQTLSLTRGIPTLQIDVDIDLLAPIDSGLHHYLCNRLAWRDESAELSANFQEIQVPVAAEWFQAPLCLQIGQVSPKLTLLPNGLPFHRRSDRRIVDTLLIVPGESRRKFRIALGLDLNYPVSQAIGWMTPAFLGQGGLCEPGRDLENWFLHFDRKNVVVTWWQWISGGSGEPSRLMFRCRETEGRSGEMTITLPRPVLAACRVSFLGHFQQTLKIRQNQQVTVYFQGFEYFQLELQI